MFHIGRGFWIKWDAVTAVYPIQTDALIPGYTWGVRIGEVSFATTPELAKELLQLLGISLEDQNV